jgi:hypothetical protein
LDRNQPTMADLAQYGQKRADFARVFEP